MIASLLDFVFNEIGNLKFVRGAILIRDDYILDEKEDKSQPQGVIN